MGARDGPRTTTIEAGGRSEPAVEIPATPPPSRGRTVVALAAVAFPVAAALLRGDSQEAGWLTALFAVGLVVNARVLAVRPALVLAQSAVVSRTLLGTVEIP